MRGLPGGAAIWLEQLVEVLVCGQTLSMTPPGRRAELASFNQSVDARRVLVATHMGGRL